MKFLAIAIFLAACPAAYASPTMSDEFVQALKDNAKDKAAGTQDLKKFFAKLVDLAERGDSSAQFLAGVTLLKADPGNAERYLSRSAGSGCAGSESALGLLDMLNKNFTRGVQHFQKAAAGGDAIAQVALSGLHERGEHGLKASLPTAYAWLLIAERQSVSSGALLAIKNGKTQLERKMSPDELSKASDEFGLMKDKYARVDYYFCGQFDLANDRAVDVPYYYRLP